MSDKKCAPINLVLLQRVIKPYRLALLQSLAEDPRVRFHVIYGEDIEGTKSKGVKCPDSIESTRMPTRNIRLGGRVLTWHVGLIGKLRELQPDVIFTEGESHFIGYLQAFLFRKLFSPLTGIMIWCFISLPGKPVPERGVRPAIKSFFRKKFDAFVLYSSFSKNALLSLGVEKAKAFVATNVCDTELHIKRANILILTKAEARKKLDLPDTFTVLYVGTLDKNKKPDLVLDIANSMDVDIFNFVICGSGSLDAHIRKRIANESISNVVFPGRVSNELPIYFRAADLVLIPGRGGIVISEAMAFSIPVIVHQADGTESDLVQDRITGRILKKGSLEEFVSSIRELEANEILRAEMGLRGRKLIESKFNTNNMKEQILTAAIHAGNCRSVMTQKNDY